VAGDVDNIIDASLDPDVPVLIASSAISSVEVSGVWLYKMHQHLSVSGTKQEDAPSYRYQGNGYGPGRSCAQWMARVF